MIKRLAEKVSRAFSLSESGRADEGERESAIQLAAAVLLADVARADSDFDESEFDLLLTLITAHFQLSPDEAVELANRASETAEESVSLHSFTHLLNNSLDVTEKERIVALLWKMVFADDRLDKYEDALVLKISDLLHVSRGRVMRLKHDADPQANQ